MAEGIQFVCPKCSFAVISWSDGNPFYLDARGKKHYAYHPDMDTLSKCVGNDVPWICLTCAHEFNVDSRQPDSVCPKCQTNETTDTGDLGGKSCPKCHAVEMNRDPEFQVIS